MRFGRYSARLTALNLAGLAALAVGVVLLGQTDLAFSPAGALEGIVSQLPVTLPAAVLVAVATACNLFVGASVVRLVLGRPFESMATLLLAGLVGAVLIDTAALMLLGGIGLFRWPIVASIQLAGLLAGWRAWPLLAERRRRAWVPHPAAWSLIAVVWAGPVLLQLASPVVPFLDVLPNYVAPVEHVRTFGSFETLTTAPSPIYASSRLLLGYVALLGTLSTLTGLPAALTVAAFAAPMTLLVALGAHILTGSVFGRRAAYWALLVAPLSVVFLRLPDARGTVLAFPIVSFALAFAIRAAARSPTAGPARDGADAPQGAELRVAAVLAGALAAGIFIHPVLGAFAAASVGALIIQRPASARVFVPALLGAAGLALPQAVVMVGLPLPSVLGLLGAPLGVLALLLGRRAATVIAASPVGRGGAAALVLVALVVGALVYAAQAAPAAAGVVAGLAAQFPLLVVGAVLGFSVARRSGRWALPLAALAVWLAASVSVALLPPGDVLADSLRFEVPKTAAYWASWMLAAPAAAALAAAWQRPTWLGASGQIVVAVFVLCATLPLRSEPVGLMGHHEYRMAESLSVSLRHAERGYWGGYPDSRTLVDASQMELLDALRAEQRRGRLGPSTQVLHVAASFQQWASTPVSVFAGVIETTASLDPERSILTAGGRLHGVEELPGLLETGRYEYVVFEPQGLDPALRETIVDAGYGSIFSSVRGEILVLGL